MVDEIIESTTNSEMGSYHWFHTLVARQKDVGEFLKEKSPSEELIRIWGKQLYDSSKELLAGYDRINK